MTDLTVARMRGRLAGFTKAGCRTCAFYRTMFVGERYCSNQVRDPMPGQTTWDTLCNQYEPATKEKASEVNGE